MSAFSSFQLRQWTPSFSTLKIGAGGQVTGIDIAPDGTKVIKTDVGGAYILNGSIWQQLITATSLPAALLATPSSASSQPSFGGVWAIAIAYSATNTIYMIVSFNSFNGSPTNYLLKSVDRGKTFTQCAGFTAISGSNFNSNSSYKFWNQKLIVDPINPNILYAAAPTGILFSNDGGATFNLVDTATIPAPTNGVTSGGLAFDTSGGTTTVGGQTVTANIIITSAGNGVWRSLNGGGTTGANWTKIADGTGTSPLTVRTAQMAASGVYWCCDGTNTYNYNAGTWIKKTFASQAVATNPADATHPNRCVLISQLFGGGAGLQQTLDGSTYLNDGQGSFTWFYGFPSPGITFPSSDIPWMTGVPAVSGLTVGDAKFDPTTGKLWIAEGIGVWWCTPPTTFSGFPVTGQSAGIEELVANDLVFLNGTPLVTAWDRAAFVQSNLANYPSSYGPNNSKFNNGWSVSLVANDPLSAAVRAYYALQSPLDSSALYSGGSWAIFAATPTGDAQNGCIAAATKTNLIQISGAGQKLYNTKNGGASWNQPATLSAITNWINGNTLCTHILDADQVTIGTFYALQNTGTAASLWISLDGGDTWASYSVTAWKTGGGFNQRLRAVPGKAGHLFYTAGTSTGSGNTPALQYLGFATYDGVSTVSSSFINKANGWANDVQQVLDFGFGMTKGGANNYPSIFMAGWIDGIYGLWRGDNFDPVAKTVTWNFLVTYPNNNPDQIKVVNGDMSQFGRCAVGFTGSGFALCQ